MISNYSDAHILLEQIQRSLIFLERPVVQQQVIVFAAAAFIAWAVSAGCWKIAGIRLEAWGNRLLHGRQQTFWRDGIIVLKHLTFPALSFAAIAVMSLVLSQRWQGALLVELRGIFWWLLGYRVGVALLYIFLGESYMRRYHRVLFTPLFVLFIGRRFLGMFVNFPIIAHYVIFQPFSNPITLGSLCVAPLTLYFLFYLSRALQDFLQTIILPRTGADQNVIHAALTIGRYIIIALGVIIIAESLGVNMSTLAFISGGLSVGIGFGLQQIVANFVSGILLLFEQTIRPGDVIDINGEMGIVEKLSIRSATLRTSNNIEIIIPNERLLTSAVTTYTRTNRLVRVLVSVIAASSNDPNTIREILLNAAQQHSRVLTDPKPAVVFKTFGAPGIDFQLAIWVSDPLLAPSVSSELRFTIWDEFAKQHIAMPPK